MASNGFTHDRRTATTTDEWFTPPAVFEALGLAFDLDPAAPRGGVPWIPARRHFTKEDDGLAQPWQGRVLLNPPDGRATAHWLTKLADQGNGLALVFARTDTAWFQRIASRVTALCFVDGRIRFHRPNRSQGDAAPSPSLLIAFGLPCALGLGRGEVGPNLHASGEEYR
jgi:hypothetical protein